MQNGIRLKAHLEMRIMKNVILFPKDMDGYPLGIYDENGKYIERSGKRIYATDCFCTTEKRLNNVAYCLEDIHYPVVYAGYIRTHWGHFMVDGMPRLWWTAHESKMRECKESKVLVFSTNEDKLPERYMQILSMLGIAVERLVYVNEPVRCREIYYPELSYVLHDYVSKAYYGTFRKVMEMVDKIDNISKIYVSKRHFSKKHYSEFGEKVIEHIFENNGYQVIYPEELSLREQLQYYKSCTEIVSVNGTIAHNILWCEPSTQQIILERFHDNPHQPAINAIIGNPVRVIDCSVLYADKNCSYLAITNDLRDFFKEEHFNVSYSWIQSALCKLEFWLMFFLKKIKRKMK